MSNMGTGPADNQLRMPYIMNGLRVSAAFKTTVDLQQTSTAYRNETVAWMPPETDNEIEITVTEDRVEILSGMEYNMTSTTSSTCPSFTSDHQAYRREI